MQILIEIYYQKILKSVVIFNYIIVIIIIVIIKFMAYNFKMKVIINSNILNTFTIATTNFITFNYVEAAN